MHFPGLSDRQSNAARPDSKRLQSWRISEISHGPSFLRILTQPEEIQVVLYLCPERCDVIQQGLTVRQSLTSAAVPISDKEFEELAGLRLAQGWGTRIFQPGHPNYQKTLDRMSELEAKERLAAFGECA